MAWSKLKNIIILILLFCNLFLLLLIVGQQISTARYEADTLTQTVAALEQNGIIVAEDALTNPELPDSLTVTHDPASEAQMAQLLLDNADIISAYSGTFNLYSSVSGNLMMQSNGEFSATLSMPWTEFNSISEHASALLAQLGITVWDMTVTDYTVTVIPMINGAPIFNAPTTLVYHENLLLSIEGYLPGLYTPDSGASDPITLPTALVSVLEYVLDRGIVCRSIERVTPGYTAALSLSGSARFTPCWLVKADTSSYYVDALTGVITPVN